MSAGWNLGEGTGDRGKRSSRPLIIDSERFCRRWGSPGAGSSEA